MRASVIIPIHNEEAILVPAVRELHAGLIDLLGAGNFEVLLAENGSHDATAALAGELAAEHAEVDNFSLGEPNYGAALREGILRARGKFVLCDEIDLCDVDFHARALGLLERGTADLVVGSKTLPGSADERPFLRRVATRTINGLLRLLLDFRGTDTHGLKAFNRASLLPVVHECVVNKDLFASEFVIRAHRSGRLVTEIPVRVAEKRPPSVDLVRRVPRVLRDLAQLTYAIRFRGR